MADRELDALVAEAVGWRYITRAQIQNYNEQGHLVSKRQPWEGCPPASGGGYGWPRPLPCYSSDDEAACQAVEYLHSRGIHVTIETVGGDERRWRAAVGGGGWHYATKLAMAVSLAISDFAKRRGEKPVAEGIETDDLR